MTLAELIAYVGDQLSYRQDAIATEAYLSTARLRRSLRRHALLVDYHLHDGCNARSWIQLQAGADDVALPQAGTRFYSRLTGMAPRIAPGTPDDEEALRRGPTVFEPLHDATLYQAHNEISFYAWGDRRCCLPRGATSATLTPHLAALAVGDVLLFEEVLGPATGEPGDADPAHRHVVRLTAVRKFSPDDPTAPLTDPLTGTAITEIAWAAEDALPFPLCISAVTDSEHGEVYLDNVSVARGNMVLADHGLTLGGGRGAGQRAGGGARLSAGARRRDLRRARARSASAALLAPARQRAPHLRRHGAEDHPRGGRQHHPAAFLRSRRARGRRPGLAHGGYAARHPAGQRPRHVSSALGGAPGSAEQRAGCAAFRRRGGA